MKRIFFFLLVSFSMTGAVLAGGPDKPVYNAFLKEATVYRSGAELFHTVKLTLDQGTTDIVIDGVANRIDMATLQVGTEGKATLLSVDFSNDYLKPQVKSALVKKLEDSVEQIRSDLEMLKVQQRTANEMLDLLRSNKQIGGSQNGVSVAELMKMMEYFKAKTLELQKELSTLRSREDAYNKTINRLNLQIQEEENKNQTPTGKLLLQLMVPQAGSFTFTLRYITPSAWWNPTYELNAENVSKPLLVKYKAKLVQTTGFDWKKVKLALSTSTPAQQNNAPLFQTWFLGYIDPVARMESNLLLNSIPSALSGRAAGVEADGNPGAVAQVKIRGMKSLSADNSPLYVVNGNPVSPAEFSRIDPNTIKSMDVLKDANATAIYGARAANGVILVTLKDGLGDYVTVNDNQLDVTFDIDLPYDVSSNGREQQVGLKDLETAVHYKYYCAPKLDKEAYLLAEVPDWEGLNLMPGEATVMFEGTYVGKTAIDPSSTQDTLNLTVGRDRRVVVKREKMKDFSSVKFLGNFKKQVFTYQLTVRNNKKEKIDMILKDQYPLSTLKDIEVELLESAAGAVNPELGVVTWNLSVNPGETKTFRISYSVKYPKDKTLNL